MATVLTHTYAALHDLHSWLALGLALIVGHFMGRLATRFRAPAVVGYILTGVLFGRSVLDVIPAANAEALGMVASLGLGVVAFMIGSELSRKTLRRLGFGLILIMVSESLFAFFCVGGAVWILSDWLLPGGLALAGALVFGAMAPASAPAGTVAVIQEYRAKGPVTSLLLAVVGLDDGFAIVLYAFAAAIAKMLLGGGQVSFAALVTGPLVEIAGGVALGLGLGAGLCAFSRTTRDRGATLTLTLGAVLLTTGLAQALHLSLILANLCVGAVMVNALPRETERSYAALERVTPPLFVLFFTVAGAHLDLALLAKLSLLGPVYIVARATGLIGGAYVGAALAKAEPTVRRYLGLGILSQAGVAIGLALTVAHEFRDPVYGQLGAQLATLTINTIAATTIIFEIVGPITTKIALVRAGEIGAAPPAGEAAEGEAA